MPGPLLGVEGTREGNMALLSGGPKNVAGEQKQKLILQCARHKDLTVHLGSKSQQQGSVLEATSGPTGRGKSRCRTHMAGPGGDGSAGQVSGWRVTAAPAPDPGFRGREQRTQGAGNELVLGTASLNTSHQRRSGFLEDLPRF